MKIENIVQNELGELAKEVNALQSAADCRRKTAEAVTLMRSVSKSGGMLLFAGNGGSALDATHLALELVGEHREGKVQRRAVSLAADPSLVLAIGNDFGFDEVFAHQLRALGKRGDLFLGISTSGNSRNVNRAFETAKEMGLHTVALLGGDGGKAAGMAQITIIVPALGAPHSQNLMRPIYHAIWECLAFPDDALE